MKKQLLFIQGGGGKEDYGADALLVASLQEKLGSSYLIHYPFLSNDSSPDFGRIKQIGEQISVLKDGMLLVGHSLGASMLLKYLSEQQPDKKIAGVFLLATPFWTGDADWVQGLKLAADFEDRLPVSVPLFFYHSRDDEVVPIEQLSTYQEKLPTATFRVIESGGHQFNNDLVTVANDISLL